MADPQRLKALIEFKLNPSLILISVVRQAVSDLYRKLLAGSTVAARLALATHELLENAVRCSTGDETHLRIEVRQLDDARARIGVYTWNKARPSDIRSLQKLIGEIDDNPDPFEHYQALMLQTMNEPEGSGLGLGRVRAECGLELTFSFEGDMVHVGAESEIDVAEVKP